MPRITPLFLLVLLSGLAAGLYAQDTAQNDQRGTSPQHVNLDARIAPHRFWDQQNAWLFAGVGAARMLDYASTHHFRNQGNDEWLLTNSIVDNKPLFVGIEIAGTAASIGVSYLFHQSGHHRLERWVSIVHIGVGVAGSVRNYTLKPPAGGAT